MTAPLTFPEVSISPEVLAWLRDSNRWWQAEPLPALPSWRRWLFEPALQRIKNGLAPVTVLRGPRQVGKSVLQVQIIDHLLHVEHIQPQRIFRVQFDELPAFHSLTPVLTLCRWFERHVLGDTFNAQARQGKPAFLFFDEVQDVDHWAPQIKALVDHHSVRVMLTGSSALRIEAGRDSLAGRVSTLELGGLLLREVGALRGWETLPPLLPIANGVGQLTEREFWETLRAHGQRHHAARDQSFTAFSERGGYPVAQARADRPWEEIADQLNETVIQRVLQHDLALDQEAEQHLLEAAFRLACRYAGQAPGAPVFVSEIHSSLGLTVRWQRVLNYLKRLSDSLLLRLTPALELRLKRQRASPKLCLCDHALRAAWLQEIVPLTPAGLERSPHLSDLAGHLAESVLGYFLGSIPNLDLAWFPQRGAEPEVDFVMTVGEHRIPLEIKYRHRVDGHRDTLGLRAFIEKSAYNAPFGVLVTLTDDNPVTDPRIVTLPLSSLLLMR